MTLKNVLIASGLYQLTYENGVKDDILDLIYRFTQRAEIVVLELHLVTQTLFNNLVRQKYSPWSYT